MTCRQFSYGELCSTFLSKFATINFVDIHWLFESPDCIQDIIMMEQVALSGGGS
jgi:hypothetical protein